MDHNSAIDQYIRNRFILESAVEHGFVENLGVSGKASIAVNGYSLNKRDNAAGRAEIFHNFL
ncbi:MAG: hypothetical protein ABW157_21950 [Candidatus Thiodiazotropha sp. LLP2]